MGFNPVHEENEMAKKLNTSVHVHTDDGGVVVYQAGDTVPKEHADKITNKDVWAETADEDTDVTSNDGAPMTPPVAKAFDKQQRRG
jgi:hypothetical protein